MIGDLGSASLALGIVAAVLAALLWLRAALSGGDTRSARTATVATLLAAASACAALETALLRHDFSVRFVAENGGRDVPVYFTVTSLWSALDGSLLLWLLIHGGYAALLSLRSARRPGRLRAYAMTVIDVVSVFFFALSYFAANRSEVAPASRTAQRISPTASDTSLGELNRSRGSDRSARSTPSSAPFSCARRTRSSRDTG